MRIIKKYDNRDPISIEKYAKGLIGKTFQWVKENSLSSRNRQISKNSSNKKGKGVLGNLIEEHYFGINQTVTKNQISKRLVSNLK